MRDCIFCRIVRGEMPCARIYEDEHVLSFLDINPINPGHALVVPKTHASKLFEIPVEELQACIVASQKVGQAVYRAVKATGMNLLQNNGRAAGQLIDHAHFHLIPRFENDGFLTTWPAKPSSPGSLEEMLRMVKENL